MVEQKSARVEEFPARFESLNPIREFVGEAARDCGLDEASVYAVQMSVDEACSNIIEHAFGGECQDLIQCACQLGEDRLTITLYDCGQPFDPSAVPEPNLEADLQDRQTGGLGLFFMHRLMDEVRFKFVPGDGEEPGCNILTMIKRKKAA